MAKETSPPTSYDGGSIRVLKGLEAVRERPGMYIGSTGPKGLHHLVYEIVDNSVDEAMAGYATHIEVELLADGSVVVTDNGRGIPVSLHPTEGKSTLEVAMTVLHAGGKFGDGGYQLSGGLHGVGMSVVNALSTRVITKVRRDGFHWHQEYTDGGKPKADVAKGAALKKGEELGTTQQFWPDASIFQETVNFDFETLRARFQQMAFLNKGLSISLTDKREVDENGEYRSVSYKYDGGLVDYVKHINDAKRSDIVNKDIISFFAEETTKKADGASDYISLEVAMQWTGAYSESVFTYANTISTPEGGTHEEGFRTALTSVLNTYARDKGILKEKDANLTGDDVREGLTAVISVKLSTPQFEGQTKAKLGNTPARTFANKVVREQLADWLDRHPGEAKEILKKASQAAAARNAARKAREATRRKGVLSSSGMPGKLKDCQTKNAAAAEIFIVEGDSAGGSAVRGRNPVTQAILPIRGKILNVEKARIDKAMANNEIQALITAFGTSIGPDFDLEKLRYHKIVLMADADVDGAHIATLLLTFLFRFVRPIIEAGYVYVANPPLYRLKWANAAHEYVYSDTERDEHLEKGLARGWRLPKEAGIQRYKGLGEMDFDELWATTMNPDTRTLTQVSMEDAAIADETFSILMGDDVESRRTFIQTSAKDVRFLDI